MKQKATLSKVNIRQRAAGLLFPKVCPLCGAILKNPILKEENLKAGDNPYICGKCYKKLDFADGKSRCLKCSRPLDDEDGQLCRDCLEKERQFDLGQALMLHGEGARKILYDLKYYGMKDNRDFLALEMAERLGPWISRTRPEVVIPVPLHRKRFRERGYNQAEELAEGISFFLECMGRGKLPVDSCYLERVHETSPLKEMSGTERARSISGVFRVNGAQGLYKSVLLVDDIFTTGATLNECAKTLKQAGTDVVYFMTVSIGS